VSFGAHQANLLVTKKVASIKPVLISRLPVLIGTLYRTSFGTLSGTDNNRFWHFSSNIYAVGRQGSPGLNQDLSIKMETVCGKQSCCNSNASISKILALCIHCEKSGERDNTWHVIVRFFRLSNLVARSLG